MNGDSFGCPISVFYSVFLCFRASPLLAPPFFLDKSPDIITLGDLVISLRNTRIGKGHLNIQLILGTLFRVNLIKVNWVMRKDLRYRPEKRVGNTRRRYITFIRRELLKGKPEV